MKNSHPKPKAQLLIAFIFFFVPAITSFIYRNTDLLAYIVLTYGIILGLYTFFCRAYDIRNRDDHGYVGSPMGLVAKTPFFPYCIVIYNQYITPPVVIGYYCSYVGMLTLDFPVVASTDLFRPGDP